MTPGRKRRLYMLLVLLAGLASAVGFTLYALSQNINLFFTPSEIHAGKAHTSRLIRLGGMVERGSLKRDKTSSKVTFIVSDLADHITVTYSGILPDLFREGQGIVATGRVRRDGIFHADEVLAKHDEKYMPPQVKSALARQAKEMRNKHDVT